MGGQRIVQVTEEWKSSGSKPVGFDLAEDFIFFGMFYPAMLLVLLRFACPLSAYLEPLILLAGLFASTFNRLRNRTFGVFLALELLICAAVAVLPRWAGGGLAATGLFALAAAAVLLVSIHRFFTGLDKDDPRYDPETASHYRPYLGMPALLLGAALLYVTYMVSLFMSVNLTLPCLGSFLAIFACFEIYRHQCGTSAVLGGDDHYLKPDTRRFRHLNLLIAGLIALLILFGGLLTYRLYIATGMVNVDRSIVTMLHQSPNSGSAQTASQSSSAPSASAPDRMKLPKLRDTHNPALIFLGRLFKIASLVLVAALVAIAVTAAAGLLINLLKYRKSEGGTSRQSVFSLEETAGRLRERMAHSRIRSFFAAGSNSARVRRLYYRFIRRQIRSGVAIAASDAPADIMRKVKTRADIADVTEIYEKARYGDEECTDEEVARMRADTRPS